MQKDEVNEVGALVQVAEILEKLEDQDAAQRVVRWAWTKYVGKIETPQELQRTSGPGASTKPRSAAKPKKRETLGLLKDLDLKPVDGLSLVAFVAEKEPTNMLEKVAVCVYYLLRHANVDNVSFNHVYTSFKSLRWRLPADLPNVIHQTGSRGWLDTSNRSSLVITNMGENFVEHDLPAKVKSK